jgi:hypothetical protein
MGIEHVRITQNERKEGEKLLLQTQLDMLSTVKRLRNYKNLRKEELNLKLVLKTKLGETETLLSEIEKLMPETEYKIVEGEKPKKVKKEKAVKEEKPKKEKEFTVEDEIDLIRKRLETMRS